MEGSPTARPTRIPSLMAFMGGPMFMYLLAGTAVRVAYAVLFKPSWQAADHLAWAIVLKSVDHMGGPAYWQLIHYPQEGGSIVVSLLTLLVARIPDVAALPASALIVDAFSRWVQLKVVARLFDRRVFHAFGAWTVFGLPILITWSSVNCGLHSLSSFFPFLVLLLIAGPGESDRGSWSDGLALGLAIWFSYDCVLLLPVYLALTARRFRDPRHAVGFCATFAGVLSLHLLIRHALDAGFHLPGWGPASVRGLDFHRPMSAVLKSVANVWTHALPGASLLPAFIGDDVRYARWAWGLFVLFGGAACAFGSRMASSQSRLRLACLLFVMVFALGYAASPIAVDEVDGSSYMYYRHWAFILPMLVLMTISGLSALTWGRAAVWCFVLLGSCGSLAMFSGSPSNESKLRDTGFVLALKLGHDPARLVGVLDAVPDLRSELLIGAGWGTAEELLVFNGPEPEDTDRLVRLLRAYPPEERQLVFRGVEYAFARNDPASIPVSTRARILAEVGMPDP